MKSSSLLIAALALAACGHPLKENPTQENILVKGAVEKGPFVLGSSITISAVDASGNPTGQTFKTQTTDDLGQFSLSVPYSGPVSIEAQGYYFDELAGDVSTSTLTLEGFGALPTSGSAQLDVNVLTHLESARVTNLMASGKSLADASAQAQSELVTALGLGAAGFTLSEPATATSLAGGDTRDDAYLLAVSLLFMQVATTDGGVDETTARLQEGLNNARSAFASAGTLPSDIVVPLRQAQLSVDPYRVQQALHTRYDPVASGFTVPDIDAILDSDVDGVPNDQDACPLVATADGGPFDQGVCSYRFASSTLPFQLDGYFMVADFNGDGIPDVVNESGSAGGAFWPGLGGGALGVPVVLPVMNYYAGQALDFDGDGKADIVGIAGITAQNTAPFYGWQRSLGDGTFAPPQELIAGQLSLPTPGAPGGTATWEGSPFQLVDLNGDGRLDAIGTYGQDNAPSSQPNSILTFLRNADGSFAAPIRNDVPSGIWSFSVVTVSDLNGDGIPDILITGEDQNCGPNGGCPGLWLGAGHGDGTFSFQEIANNQNQTQSQPLVADVTGDGKPDLVFFTPSLSDATVDVFVNDGSGNFNLQSAYHLDAPSLDNSFVLLTDVTGDGVPDLAFEDWTSRLVVYPSLGSGWGPPQTINLGGGHPTWGGVEAQGGFFVMAMQSGPDNAHPGTLSVQTVTTNPAGWHSW